MKAVVLGNARRCLISAVGRKQGSRAARAFQAHSACRRQFAVIQHIPIGILRLKQIWMLSRPQWALGACRAYRANRHHCCNNKGPESSHGRAPNGCCFRAEHSRWFESAALLNAFPSGFLDEHEMGMRFGKNHAVNNHGCANGNRYDHHCVTHTRIPACLKSRHIEHIRQSRSSIGR
ncbi:hypothetical protein [Bradyrhizobium glycinis]|uniref:hypothetical protein n=1 Tax=Bradyrhizobium glycinis TaxID=2751812 RepID=UPI0018D80C17|nr:hypothetical protein [Bradyrhizobium glycinis]MBH5369088.1 hypothetical protein [Bradyrhizobium glycinis]